MKNKYLYLIAMLFLVPFTGIAQINLAPSATVSHSAGSGSGIYGPLNYNDGIIIPGTYGWINANNTSGTSAWVQFDWPASVAFDNITFFPDAATTRTLTGATIQVWNGSSWVNHYTYTVPPSTMYNVKFPPATTNSMRITNLQTTGSQNNNPALNEIQIFLSKIGTDNAGLSAILSTYECAGTHPIDVVVGNFGFNQINSVTINWTLGGLLQTPISVTSLLDTLGGPNPSTDTITLGNHTYVSGVSDALMVWTSMPNGNVDMHPGNDSAVANIGGGLAGSYTIDPFGSGSTNFSTFTDATKALSDFGICGPVIFNVAQGFYPEQISLNNIVGASAQNSVIFRADPNNTLPVEISYSGTPSDNYVVRFNGARFVTFEHISILPSGSYSTAVKFEGTATDNQLKNCRLVGPLSSTTSTNNALIYANGMENGHNLIEGNHIYGGSYGIYYRGSSTASLVEGIQVRENTIEDPYYMGMYFYYTDGLKVYNNRVSSISPYTSGYGIYSYYGYNDFQVVGNEVLSKGNAWPYNGLHLYYPYGADTARALIANNMVHVGNPSSSASHYGLISYGATYCDVLYNTVVVESFSTAARAGYLYSGSYNRAYNNNFLNYGSGYSIYTLTNNYTWDHNNLASAGSYLAYHSGTIANFAAWQSAGNGANSINVNNIYPNPDSLRTCDTSLYKKGVAMNEMSFDYDGDPRMKSTPNIGADEFIADAADFSIGDTINFCGGTELEIGASMNDASFNWSTGDTTATIFVTQEGNYLVTVNGPCVAGMVDDVQVIDVNPVANFTYDKGNFIGGFTNTSEYGTSYLWSFGDGTTSTQENPWHQYPGNGTYLVTLTVMNDCDTVTFSQIVGFSVGLGETDLGKEISIYPNPARDFIKLAVGKLEDQTIRLQLFDMTGQLHADQQMKVSKGGVEQLNIAHLSKGIYLIKLTADNEVSTRQIVVQ